MSGFVKFMLGIFTVLTVLTVTASPTVAQPPPAYRIFAAFLNNVAEINPATGTVISTPLPGPLAERGPCLLVPSPDGRTVYVVDVNAGEVLPFSVATGRPASAAIRVGVGALTAVLAPSGTLYVGGKGTVTPVYTATDTAGAPIKVTGYATSMVLAPDGTLYVAGNGIVTPIHVATNTAGRPIRVGRGSPSSSPGTDSLAITPSGRTVWDALASGFVVPINTATNKTGTPMGVSGAPLAIAITPSGTTAYVVREGNGWSAVSPLDLATHTVEKSIPVPNLADWIMMSPSGQTVYVGYLGGPVIPINTATNVKGPFFGWSQLTMSMAFAPSGSTAYTCGFRGVIPVSTRTYTLGATLYDPPADPCQLVVAP